MYLLQIGARKHQVYTAETKLCNANENVDRYAGIEIVVEQLIFAVFQNFKYCTWKLLRILHI